MYNQVEEQAHVLVQRSNMSLEHLEYLLELREVEGHLMQVPFLITDIHNCLQMFR